MYSYYGLERTLDWHDNWYEKEDVSMKTYLVSDTHFNHGNIATYCQRPADFTDLIQKNWRRIVQPEDVVIHLGDVGMGNASQMEGNTGIIKNLPGRKILVRGNHDRKHSVTWWMSKGGFDFACDSMIFRGCLLTHEPARKLPLGCTYNVHGHLHNIWHGFHPNASVDQNEETKMKAFRKLLNPWQRLFAVEYTDYSPVEMNKFLDHADKYFAKGIPDV